LSLKNLTNTLTKKLKILVSIGAMILGWIVNAFALTTIIGHPISTICLLFGLGLFIGGLIFLISTLRKRTTN